MSDSDLAATLAEFGSPQAQAIAAAFALVTVYDGKVEAAELGRFVEIAVDDSELRPSVLAQKIEALVGLLEADRDNGDPVVFGAIEAVKGDEKAVARVRRAAREAVYADARVDLREQLVLREIAERLDCDPSTF